MAMKWKIRPHDAELIQSIERESKVTAVVAQLLALRGITHSDQVHSFLNLKMTNLADPFELPGMEEACQTILSAIGENEKITIYGDYDCDGMTSTAILCDCIKLLGGDVNYFVPNRLDDGYGVNKDALDRLHKKGTKLVVTVDCGISSVQEVAHANQLGMKMIVTDHHQPGETLPAAAAIVHPALPGKPYRFAGLCGAGVAFKLAWGLCQRQSGSEKLPPPMRDFLFKAIGLAAIGTVADVVPLLDENRIIVHYGLTVMRQFCSVGFSELVRVASLTDKQKLGAEDIAFTLGPRLNAAGRLGQAQLGVELLMCNDESRATQLAEYINELNKSRDSLENSMRRAAKKMIKENHDPENEPAFVLAQADWHQGVLGIVAGRLAELYNRPTIMISIDKMGEKPAVGSCRSACGLNLYQALASCSDSLIKFGGHVAAAGLKIDAAKIDQFREEFCDHVSSVVPSDKFQPQLKIDAEAPLSQLTLDTLFQMEQLAPFGMRNPRPVLCASGVSLAEPAKTMGADGKHLSLNLTQHGAKVRAVAFGKGEWAQELDHKNGVYDFAFKPSINEFRGRRSVQLKLIDFRPAKSTVPAMKSNLGRSSDSVEVGTQ
jgi:single-stranded-DNA-specific exonuclease